MQEIQFHNFGSAFFLVGFILVSVIGTGLLMTGLLAFLQSMVPGVLGRATTAIRHHPVASPLVGAGVFIALLLIAKLGARIPAVGPIVLLDFIVFAVFGLAATSEDIGRRLAWMAGKEGNRVSHLATGWLVFFTASCIPFMGWFVIFPYGVLGGIGSLLVGFAKPAAPAGPSMVDVEIR